MVANKPGYVNLFKAAAAAMGADAIVASLIGPRPKDIHHLAAHAVGLSDAESGNLPVVSICSSGECAAWLSLRIPL